MKRIAIIAIIVLALAGVTYAVYTTGTGKIQTVTTTPARLTDLSSTIISIYNDDSTDIIFALANITTNAFATRLAAGTCIPIPPKASYTIDNENKKAVQTLVLATTNGTAVSYIAGNK